jgi:CrcB protein
MSWIPIAISIGAIFGALGRYYATLFWIEKRGNEFPCGTLFVNLMGAFLIGLAAIVLTPYDIPITLQKMVLVGFLGSFTTFSTYILDAVNLFGRGSIILGLLYWLGSPVLGLICVELGIWVGQQLG